MRGPQGCQQNQSPMGSFAMISSLWLNGMLEMLPQNERIRARFSTTHQSSFSVAFVANFGAPASATATKSGAPTGPAGDGPLIGAAGGSAARGLH